MNTPEAASDAYWRGSVDTKLDAVLNRIDALGIEKESTHRTMYARLEQLERTQAEHYTEATARWARLLGLGVGLMIGAGAVGGGAGALITSLLGG